MGDPWTWPDNRTLLHVSPKQVGAIRESTRAQAPKRHNRFSPGRATARFSPKVDERLEDAEAGPVHLVKET